MTAKCSPSETCAQDLVFVTQCSLDGLRQRLPLRWSAPPDIPPSPKNAYRSHYAYLGCMISKTQPPGNISPTLWLGHRPKRSTCSCA
jgi:hypothetical protein